MPRALACSLLFSPFSIASHRSSQSPHSWLFLKLPCPELVHTNTFLPCTPLCHICIPNSPQSPYSQPRNKWFQCKQLYISLEDQQSWPGGNRESMSRNVKLPQPQISSSITPRIPTALSKASPSPQPHHPLVKNQEDSANWYPEQSLLLFEI